MAIYRIVNVREWRTVVDVAKSTDLQAAFEMAHLYEKIAHLEGAEFKNYEVLDYRGNMLYEFVDLETSKNDDDDDDLGSEEPIEYSE